MTRNLYSGADVSTLQSALTPADLTSLASGFWADIVESDFRARAAILADEIVRSNPDVIALQEVWLLRTQTPGDWVSPTKSDATQVYLDFLVEILGALANQGARYQTATIGINGDQELPTLANDGTMVDVRLTDRNVILVREGLTFAPGPSGRFQTAFNQTVGGIAGATLKFERGYVTADVTIAGKTVHVVDAHLEVGGVAGRLQEQQTRELLTALGSQTGPLILAGDFNSPADGSGTATYGLLTTKSGSSSPFRDTWDFRQLSSPSVPTRPVMGAALPNDFTCCMDLRATVALPSERIDLILFRGGVLPADAQIVGTTKTPSGLWPSNHMGVLASLEIP